ncbi:DUF4209 domain-containing protein [Candidatus Poriferisocius sp.]|uniref:DUF4209 domain-containing protein n=1 Tax=Candidatus Poriferisocius sp. TaxID=3101276 RepID=UPI003B01E3C7
MSELGKYVSLSGLARHLGGGLSDSDPVGGLVVALQFRFIVDSDDEGRQLFGPFGPMFEGTLESGEPFRVPQDLGEVSPDVIELWGRCARAETHPMVRARLADLLWEVREGASPHLWALLAIESYVATSEVEWDDRIGLRNGLIRALELCRLLNQPDKEGPVVRAVAEMAQRSLGRGTQEPGVVFPILELLAAREDPAAEQLVSEALDVYGDDPWTMESLLEIHAQMRPPEERAAIWEQQVESYVAEADCATGLRRHALLRKAAELAASKGLTATHEDIATRIEAISWEEMDFGKAQVETEIDGEAIEEWVTAIVGDDDLDSALGRFGSEIPSGDVEENRDFVEELAREYPFQRLASQQVIGDYQSVLWQVSGPESQQEFDLYRYEQQRVVFFAHLHGQQALRRIVSRYPISVENLTGLFTTQLIEQAVAERMARSVELWQQGDPDSAVAVLVPRLERIIRNACHLGGLRVTKHADMKRGLPGGVLSLGALLSSLEGKLGESERRYLRGTLVEVTSLNLRNRVAHGLIDNASDADFVVLFQIACWLRLLTVSTTKT